MQESKTRQVIVFTHDIVFLLSLRQYADELGVEPFDQHVRHQAKGAGVCAEELPWVALPVKKKIGYLKMAGSPPKSSRAKGIRTPTRRKPSIFTGLLREAWERALEEVLLGGVVERYRPGVQTQQIAQIADISDDCKAVETAMTKCSTWLPVTTRLRQPARRCLRRPNSKQILKRLQAGLQRFANGERRKRRLLRHEQRQHQTSC